MDDGPIPGGGGGGGSPFVPRVTLDALQSASRRPEQLWGGNDTSPPQSAGGDQQRYPAGTFPSSPWGTGNGSGSAAKFQPDFLMPNSPTHAPPTSISPDSNSGGDMIDALMEQQQQQHRFASPAVPTPPAPLRLRGGGAHLGLGNSGPGALSRSRFAVLGAHSFADNGGGSAQSQSRRVFTPSFGSGDSGSDCGSSIPDASTPYFSPDAPVLASRRLGGQLVSTRSLGCSPAPSGGLGSSHSFSQHASANMMLQSPSFSTAATPMSMSGPTSAASSGFGTPASLRPSSRQLQAVSAAATGGASSSSVAAATGANMMLLDSPATAMRGLHLR